ncbi:MAG: type I-B CRISPR-associated protein Cas7/Csh2 [Promethearchaeota archaeon]
MSEKIVDKNGEILFIYDAETCNPNGDPDNENKPRMDYLTSTNLVSDVRLKRYIRDYIELHKNQEIYLTNPDGIVLNATNRLKYWKFKKEKNKTPKDLQEIKKTKINDITKKELLDNFIDIRFFGATIPIKSTEEGKSGSSITFIGPIQFNWGKSFNEVEIMQSSGITSHLSSEEGAQGAMGSDFRVYYSLIGFHGIISAIRATNTALKWDDINLFDEAMIKSIPNWITRSKINQYPRVYLRICYNSNDFFIGDLRNYVNLENKKDLRTIGDVSLYLEDLTSLLEKNIDKIEYIKYFFDEHLRDQLKILIDNEKIKSKLQELTF